MIETDRLNLVQLTVADASEMVEVLSDPMLYEFIGGQPPDLEQLTRRYEHQQVGWSSDRTEQWHNWIVRRREDGVAIGYVQATVVGASAEIAWVIARRWQGNRYASEASRGMCAWLESQNVQRVVAHIHPGHAASAAVATTVGLRPTPRLVDGEVEWAAELAK